MKKDMNARMSLRTIFDQTALDYDEVRPGWLPRRIDRGCYFYLCHSQGRKHNPLREAWIFNKLLNTYSGHRNLEEAKRSRLFRDIGELIENEYRGTITRPYLAVLYIGKKRKEI